MRANDYDKSVVNFTKKDSLTLKMVLHLWLILFTAFALPENGTGYFIPNLRWVYVGHNGLMLRWDTAQFAYQKVEWVRMVAELVDSPVEKKEESANMESGRITLYGFEPYTYYRVTVQGYRDGRVLFDLGSFIRTLPTAPAGVLPPTGRAISTEEIELQWLAPTRPNGILKPYVLTCFDVSNSWSPVSVTTKNNETLSVSIENLHPGTEYRCYVLASTVPGVGQISRYCERRSELSNPIRTMALAPSRIPRPKGKAISSTEIELTWSKPKHSNGILKPYLVTCLDVTHCSAPSRITTNDSETTSVVVGNLIPNTFYQCSVMTSTIPAIGQDATQCERRSELSTPIRTMSLVEFGRHISNPQGSGRRHHNLQPYTFKEGIR
ncbi:unnamed protein product [Hydatigera taeniaeformis]|uniref:Fibronectin type-III domain-containing protein n=1 Tax=Hydatigena taeniaeformis TaxID=6205 RepID=A0A0R3WQF4_HYDTA|nr:unnamed protein product [Hydatigera taeniaeformis]